MCCQTLSNSFLGHFWCYNTCISKEAKVHTHMPAQPAHSYRWNPKCYFWNILYYYLLGYIVLCRCCRVCRHHRLRRRSYSSMMLTFVLMVMAAMTIMMMFSLKPSLSGICFTSGLKTLHTHTLPTKSRYFMSKRHFECHKQVILNEKVYEMYTIHMHAYTNRVTTRNGNPYTM